MAVHRLQKPEACHLEVTGPVVRCMIQFSSVQFQFSVGSYLKFCSLNARSVRNKSADFVSYVESSGADILAVTETWLSEVDNACRAEITPPGYKLFDQIRSDRTGGGTALLIRENLHASRVDAGVRTLFTVHLIRVTILSPRAYSLLIFRVFWRVP